MQANPKKEFFHVSGDQHSGVTSGVNLNQSALCHPVVYYPRMGEFLTLDVFALPGVPMYVVVRCPVCLAKHPYKEPPNDLTIKADQKDIELDHKALPKFTGFELSDVVRGLGLPNLDALRGRITIEEFGCTWEEEEDLKRDFGLSCCPWNVTVVNNIVKDVTRRR